ncbi:MAG: hypothetical protein ABUT39_28185 [Acidobacteriota bacterium]
MLLALFLREFRKSWAAHAGALVAIAGTAMLLDYALARGGLPNPEEQLELNNWLLAGLVASGLISGERCFSKSFKEGRYPFLLTLPRPRTKIWLAYLGGRLIGALAALPVFLLRWLTSPLPEETSWLLLVTGLAIYLVYFLGGTALSFAFQKEILVYLIGFPLFTTLLLLLDASAFYSFASGAPPLSNPRFLLDVLTGALLLAFFWAIVAHRAFCRGELHLGRRAAQTFAEAVLGSIVFASLTAIVFSSTSLIALGDEWQPSPGGDKSDSPYLGDVLPVSADGRFLFIHQRLKKRPVFTRLGVIGLTSGRLMGWLEKPGIHDLSWSASGAVLNVLTTDNAPIDCWGFLCEGATSWYRLSPDLHVLSVRKFPGAGFLYQLAEGGLFLITWHERTGTVYQLSDQDGDVRKILASELDGFPQVWSLGTGSVVVFPKVASLKAWWLDPVGQIRHEASMKHGGVEHYYIVGTRMLSLQEAKAEIRRRAMPVMNLDLEPLLPLVDGPLNLAASQFFFSPHLPRRGKTEVWRRHMNGDWARILWGLRIGNLIWSDVFQRLDSVDFASADIDYQTWTWAAALYSESHHRLVVYDDQLNRSIPTEIACRPGEEGMARLNRVQGFSGLVLRYVCSDPTGRQRHWFLNLIPGSGKVRYLPAHSAAVPPDAFGRWIYLDPDGVSAWLSKAGEVWRVAPGQKPLRLNPPAQD